MFEDQILIDKITELQLSKGSIAKSNIIKKYSDNENFKKFLYYLLNPMLTFKVSENALTNSVAIAALENRDINISFENIFEVCETLSAKPALSKEDVKTVSFFLAMFPQEICDEHLYSTLKVTK